MQLITWWYDWGMFFFAFIDLVVIVWVIYDSSVRGTSSVGWRLGTIAPTLLLIPAIMWRFAGPATQITLANLQEPFFWIGLVGGLIPFIVGVGYVLSVSGSAAPSATAGAPNMCPIHGQFDPRYTSCPMCAMEAQSRQARAASSPARESRTFVGHETGRDAQTRISSAPSRASSAPKANALLYMEKGTRAGTDYRLNVGTTSIGRAGDNDIAIDDDTISRQHALIREENARFVLHDRGSTDGTYVNNQKLRGPLSLQDGDQVSIGNTVFRFKIL